MTRRALLATLLAALVLPAAAGAQTRAPAAPAPRPAALTAQDRADIARIEAYLNGVGTLRARFLQVAPDGQVTEGNAWIQRPGRMRFEYDPPTPLLLVASRGSGLFYDKALQQVTYFPIGSSPLGMLLSENLRLAGDVTVSAVERLPGQIQVTMYRTAAPGDGLLTLVFAEGPLSLRQWMITDPQQRETTVSLFNMSLGGTFDQKLFDTTDPRPK